MTNPWDGPRHRSWASNTMLTFLLLVVCIIATVVSDVFGEPPTYLVALLGTTAGAFFTALGSDKQKRTNEVGETADRAERKADDAETTARRAESKADAADHRADGAEHRETGWSRHRDHHDVGGGDGGD